MKFVVALLICFLGDNGDNSADDDDDEHDYDNDNWLTNHKAYCDITYMPGFQGSIQFWITVFFFPAYVNPGPPPAPPLPRV